MNSSSSGWAEGSYFYIVMDDIEILRDRLDGKARAEVSFNPTYTIAVTDSWSYSQNPQSTIDWRYSVNPTWQSGVAGTYPNVNANTRYFSRSVTVPPMWEGYPSFEVGVFSREGVVLYINGEEVARKNLPLGPVYTETQVTKLDTTSSYLRFIGSRDLFMNGASVTVAVEIHKDYNQTLGYIDDFKAYLLPHQQSVDYRVADGIATCTTSSPTNQEVENLFDNSKDTEWTAYTDPSIQVTYTFNNNRREWFNRYVLVSSSSNAERDPLSWRIEGSNDGLSWDRIDYQSNYIFPSRQYSATFKVQSNRLAYNAIRLSIIAVRGKSETVCQLAEFRLLATDDPVLSDELVYPYTEFTYISGVTENFSIKPESSGYQAYSITPDLPEGMTLDQDSGEISGSTDVNLGVMTSYVITAMSSVSGMNRTASVSIMFTTCNDDTHSRIDIVKYNVPTSDKESWQLVCNDGTDVSSTGVDGYETQIVRTCVSRTMCQLKMTDSLGDAWSKGAYVDITVYNHDTPYHLGKALVTDSDTFSVNINTEFLVSEKSATTYVYTGAEYRNAWYSDSSFLSNGLWTTASAVGYVPRRHWYIYNTVNTVLTANHTSYSVRFYTRAGVALYVNNVERYRANIPAGDVNMNTDITGGSSIPSWHTYTGSTTELINGMNTFAFDVVNAASFSNVTCDFDMAVYLSMSGDGISFTEDAVAESSNENGSYPVSRIIDGDWDSYSLINRANREDQQWVGVKYESNTRRFINKYCVTCNPDFSRYDPTEWQLVAANDESNDVSSWDILDTRSNVRFSKRSQRLCYTTNSTAAYNMYRLVMKANRNIYPVNAFGVAELELYAVTDTTGAVFEYQMTIIQAYQGLPIPTQTTTAPIGMVTVTPPLPTGITLDPYTGRISGTPTTTAPSQTYTFTNTIGTNTQTTSIVLTVDMCTDPKRHFFIHVPTSGALGPQLTITVKQGNSTEGAVLSVPKLPLYEEVYYPVCMDPDHITVVAAGSVASWGMYHVEILAEDYTIVGYTGYTLGEVYYPFYQVRPNASWKYVYGSAESNWADPAFVDATWGSATPGTLPELSNTAQYYRTTFTLANPNITTTVYYKIRVVSGAIIYINGKEIYRVNMPSGTPTSNTLASSEFITPQTISGSAVLTSDLLVAGNNVVAVENHVLSGSYKNNIFLCTILIADYGTYALLEGTPSADIMNDGSHGYLKAFDYLTSTSYMSGPRCENAILQWTYPLGSRYAVNSYSVNSHFGACASRFPSSWAVEGSNDGSSWTMVDYMPDTYSSTGGNTITRSFLANNKFNSYRLRVTGCKNRDMSEDCEAGLTINEFYMYHNPIDFATVCQGDLTFGPAAVGSYSFASCPSGYTGYRRRLCQSDLTFDEIESMCTPETPSYLSYPQSSYELTTGMEISSPIVPTVVCYACTFTSNPSLPTGLVLNAANGAISGTGQNNTQAFYYTITGRNTAGSISSVLRISVVSSGASCPADFTNNWPATPAGVTATRSCPDVNFYSGNMTRLCQLASPPVWGPITNGCVLLAPNITYASTNVTIEKNAEMSVLQPTIFGAEITLTINPQLPAGMYFDTTTGTISGAPSIKDLVGTDYNITISNAAGSYTTSLHIVIISLTCPADGLWPETDRGEKAWLSCGSQKEGQYYRECQNVSPPTWGSEVNNCVWSQPVISYPSPALSLYRNVPMTAQTPQIVNYHTQITINPSLPQGLSINPSSGVISGTPTAVSAQASYTVTVSNPNSMNTFVITITVDILKCPTTGEWMETEHSQTATAACTDPTNMEGTRTRMCLLSGSSASWGVESSTCKYRQPVVTYPSSIVGYKDEPIGAVEPSRQYRVTSFTINPALPAGLSINGVSGMISGTPTVGMDTTIFTIVASNEDNQTTATISISVIVPMCAADGDWAATERGLTAYVHCPAAGVRTRVCGTKTERNPTWSEIDATMCMETPEKTKPSEGKSFIRFSMIYRGISKSSVTAYEEEMMRLELAAGIQDKGVATNQVVIQSVADASGNVEAVFRVEVLTTNIDAVKVAMETYVNTEKKYATALKALGGALANVECTLNTESYAVKKYSSMNAIVVVLITLLIIFILMFAALFVFYINIRKKSATSGGRQQLRGNNSFVPAGNIGTQYSSSPKYDDDDDYPAKKQSRYVSDEEEEEEYTPRRSPKKQSRYVSDEEEEEEEEEHTPRKKSKKNMKGRV